MPRPPWSPRTDTLFPLPTLFRSRRGVVILITRGIDDAEIEPDQMRVPLAPIVRHPRLIVDQRELLADEPVEQRRLADIGPAVDRDSGKPGQQCLPEFHSLHWEMWSFLPMISREHMTIVTTNTFS